MESVIALGSERRELRIKTHKNAVRGGVQVGVDRLSYTHAFGLGGKGDFSRTLIHDKTARATEKKLCVRHDAALRNLATLLADARAHYLVPSDADVSIPVVDQDEPRRIANPAALPHLQRLESDDFAGRLRLGDLRLTSIGSDNAYARDSRGQESYAKDVPAAALAACSAASGQGGL